MPFEKVDRSSLRPSHFGKPEEYEISNPRWALDRFRAGTRIALDWFNIASSEAAVEHVRAQAKAWVKEYYEAEDLSEVPCAMEGAKVFLDRHPNIFRADSSCK